MKRSTYGLTLAIAAATALSPLHGEPQDRAALQASEGWRNAMAALSDQLPDVAARRLTALLDSELTDEARAALRLQLAEVLVRAAQPKPALEQLEQIEEGQDEQKLAFWRGQALALVGRYADAVEAFRGAIEVSGGSDDLSSRARISQAMLLSSLQRPEEAQQALAPLVEDQKGALSVRAALLSADLYSLAGDSDRALALVPADEDIKNADLKAQAQYFRGRLALERGDALAASEVFSTLIDAEAPRLEARLQCGAQLGWIGAQLELDRAEEAQGALVKFIDEHPEGPFLDQAFAMVIRLALAAEPLDASLLAKLRDWSPAPVAMLSERSTLESLSAVREPIVASERTTFSLYALSRILREQEGQQRAALTALKRLQVENPRHYLARLSLVEAAHILHESGETDAALGVLETAQEVAISPRLRSIAGFHLARFMSESEVAADEVAQAFADVTQAAAEDIAEIAAYNSSLYAIASGDDGLYAAMVEKIGSAEMRTTLSLERALARRYASPTLARAALIGFIEESPDHPRVDEARMALVESALAAPVDAELAKKQLSAINPGLVSLARLAQVRLQIALAEQDYEAVSAIGQEFIENNPDDPATAAITLALGQAQFEEANYYAAWKLLEKLGGQEDVAAEIREAALFLAGVSASRGATDPARESAIVLFESAIGLAGQLEGQARYEKASQLIFFGRIKDALDTLEPLISAEGAESWLHVPAVILAAQARLEQVDDESAATDAAIALYDTALASSRLTTLQREELIFLKATAHQQVGRTDVALDLYYQIVNAELDPTGTHFRWREQAGLKLMDILEARMDYKAAIAIARRLEAAGGPLAAEAKARADKLALEHMIFDQ